MIYAAQCALAFVMFVGVGIIVAGWTEKRRQAWLERELDARIRHRFNGRAWLPGETATTAPSHRSYGASLDGAVVVHLPLVAASAAGASRVSGRGDSRSASGSAGAVGRPGIFEQTASGKSSGLTAVGGSKHAAPQVPRPTPPRLSLVPSAPTPPAGGTRDLLARDTRPTRPGRARI